MTTPPGRHIARRRVHRARLATIVLPLLLAVMLQVGCRPPIVRTPVPAEKILVANEAAREADIAFARRDFYAALIKYLEATRSNPNSEYIYNKLGITYSQLQYYPEATNAFERAIGLNPKYAYPYNNLSSVYFAASEKGKAERFFRNAISLNPNVASFHVNLGTLYFEKKKMDKGMEEWRKGIALDSSILGKTEGISLVAAGSKRSSTDKNYFMARLFASMGDAERAVDNLQQALNAGFTNIDAINKERDFDPIRENQKFQSIMRSAALLPQP